MKKTLELIKNYKSGQFIPDSKLVYDEKEVFELARLLRRIRYAPSQIRKKLQEFGVTVAPASFYSDIPLVEEIEASQNREKKLVLDGIFNDKIMKHELEKISVYSQYFNPEEENSKKAEFTWKGGPFSQSDAMAYYCYIRSVKPNTIIEIGSGWSTLVARQAIQDNGRGRILCVEPFPSDMLLSIKEIELIPEKVQNLDDQFLNNNLNDGDILFIDSTHTVKHDSDCVHIYLKLLPNVQKNIIVHAHDIYLPGSLPLNYLRDKQIYWTEQYLLYAYIVDNPRVQVLFGTQYHMINNRDALRDFMGGKFPEGGASIWFSHHRRRLTGARVAR